MNAYVALWLFFRCVRWAAWLLLLGFSLYFWSDRAPWVNSFGQLKLGTEMLLFGPGLVAVFAGLFELMMRERAHLQRPAFGTFIPPKAK